MSLACDLSLCSEKLAHVIITEVFGYNYYPAAFDAGLMKTTHELSKGAQCCSVFSSGITIGRPLF